MKQQKADPQDAKQFLVDLESARKRNDWQAAPAMLDHLPDELEGSWLLVADEIAFALGQRGDHDRAIAVFSRAYSAEANYRRASAIAYLHYAAALARHKNVVRDHGKASPPVLEELRVGFRRWIVEALRRHPRSVKDLYRLGIFEAQVESCHDKAALRAFTTAIDAYRELFPSERTRRHDLRKYYLRALYAAGRSALRLSHLALARRCTFACIREDATTHHVEAVHKLGLGGRVCLAAGQLDHAERAFRLALDAKGPPARDYLFGYLAEVSQRREDLTEAARWIEAYVRPERRSTALWRQLGDIERARERFFEAETCYRAALLRDRTGRHLTFVRLAEVLWTTGNRKQAERAFRDAIDFRRRMYQSDDHVAIFGLAQILDAMGRADEAEAIRTRAREGSAHDDRQDHRPARRRTT